MPPMFPPASRFFTWLLQKLFDLLYHQLAWSYDLVAWMVSAGRWKDWVFSVLPHLEGQDVLEIGHGPGHLLVAMRAKGFRGVGIDASRQMGIKAKKNVSKGGFGVGLVNGYAQYLPFKVACFNTVVATFPSNYIVDPKTLLEIRRTLKPGGVLIIVLSAFIEGESSLDRLLVWLFHRAGLSPGWDDRFFIPISQAGFDVTVQRERLSTSSVLMIHARRS